MRIVSLLPSATEIISELGFAAQLVGRSHECDWPDSVKSLPVLTEASISSDASSADIDRQVKSILERGLSLYRVKTDLLRQLKPDVIVTQTQCEVCAVSESELNRALADWTGGAPRIVSLAAENLAGIGEDFRKVAAALDAVESGERLCRRFDSDLARLRSATQNLEKPQLLALEWLDPLMASGNWMPELIEIAGAMTHFGEAGKHSDWIDWNQVVAADPDVLLLIPCGFSIVQSLQEVPNLQNRPEWPQLKAVHNRRVFVADGNHYFNRPGPRLVDSAEILAEILHPEVFAEKKHDAAWKRLPF